MRGETTPTSSLLALVSSTQRTQPTISTYQGFITAVHMRRHVNMGQEMETGLCSNERLEPSILQRQLQKLVSKAHWHKRSTDLLLTTIIGTLVQNCQIICLFFSGKDVMLKRYKSVYFFLNQIITLYSAACPHNLYSDRV